MTARTAYKDGETNSDETTKRANDILTVPVNLAGLPAISLPCGFSEENLPMGLQIIGKAFDERTLYRAAHAYEKEIGRASCRERVENCEGAGEAREQTEKQQNARAEKRY